MQKYIVKIFRQTLKSTRFAVLVAAAGFFFALPALALQELPDSATTITLQSAYPGEFEFFIGTNTVITAAGSTAVDSNSAQNWLVTNYGTVSGTGSGSATNGIFLGSLTLGAARVNNYGVISSAGNSGSTSAVRFSKGGNFFNYAGAIISSNHDGVHADGGDLVVENDGMIDSSASGFASAVYAGEGLTLHNYITGSIIGAAYGINSNSNDDCIIINEGFISGTTAAINFSGAPSDYFIHNTATGKITTAGNTSVSFNGNRALMLNQGLVENTSNNATHAIILITTLDNDIIVNAGTMTAVGVTTGISIQGQGTTFYNLGILTSASGNSVSVSGSEISVVLGQYYTMTNGTIITGQGSNITGDLVNTGTNNKIILQDNGSEDDDFTGFQSLVMNGKNWTLSNNFNLTGGQSNDIDVIAGKLLINGTGSAAGGITVRNGGTLLVGDLANLTASLTGTNGIAIEQGGIVGGAGSFTGAVSNAGTIKSTQFNITGNIVNSGIVDLRSSSAGNTLTVQGAYQGVAGSALIVNAAINGNSSVADKLAVNTGSISGITNVYVNVSGSGTKADNVAITDLQSGATSDAGAFKLAKPVFAGAYEYGLFQNLIDFNWYLQAVGTRAGVFAYLGNIDSALKMFQYSFTDRGAQSINNPLHKYGIWARAFGASWERSASGGGTIDSDTQVMQVGCDLISAPLQTNSMVKAGIMGGYGYAESDAKSEGRTSKAKGSLTGSSIGAYATLFTDREEFLKLYIDTWFQYGWNNNTIEGMDKLEYDSNTMSASVEMGYSWAVIENKKLVIVPNMQIVWSDYEAQNLYHSASSSQIKDEVTGFFTSKYGLRAYSQVDVSDFVKTINPFVEISWLDSNGNIETSVNDYRAALDEVGNGLQAKLGVDAQIGKHIYASLNVEAQSGQSDYRLYSGNLAVKYAW